MTALLVVDTSAAAGALMPDEDGPSFAEWAGRFDAFAAPWLFWVEFRNVLLKAERRGRTSADATDRVIRTLDDFGVALDTTPAHAAVMDLARRHRLTVYDALYLELAQRRGGALATLDGALAAAARAEGVAVA